MQPTQFQNRVLAIPEPFNICLGGGRGGGKTTAALLRITRHLFKYKNKARVWIVRENYKGLQQIEESLSLGLAEIFGVKAVSLNRQDHVCRIQGHGSVEFC